MDLNNIEKSDDDVETPLDIPLETPLETTEDIPTPVTKNKVFNNSDAVVETEKIDKPITIPKKKVKEDKRKTKPRTEKQIAAFEKLKSRRAEQVELIKKAKLEEETEKVIKKKSKVRKKKEVIYESSDDDQPSRKVINNYYYNYNPKEHIKPIEQQAPTRPSAPTPEKQRPIVYFG